jgi:hypothetical protein
MDDETQTALEQNNNRLDYIEEHIVSMSRFGSQLPFVAMGRADHRPTDPAHIPPEVVELARAGKRRQAIVKYRELTGGDVQQAQSVVDGISS